MSGLNISNYLSQTTGMNVNSNSNMDILFGSLSGSNKNSNNVSSIFGASTNNFSANDALGISYSDYASIKSGSYGKLMNKYYKPEGGKASKEDIEAFKKKLDATADKAAKASSNIDDLLDMKYTEENRDKITEKIEAFVSDYNSMVKNLSSTDSSSIKQKSDWMNNMVGQYSDALSNIGITFNSSDKTLSIDKEALSKANMSSIKATFGADVNSFSNKVLYKAEQIYSLAKTYGSSATAYTSDGTYNRDYSSNYDTTT